MCEVTVMADKYCWTLGWGGTVELGIGNGRYLPRKAALLLHGEYFDENGEPILSALPMDRGQNNG